MKVAKWVGYYANGKRYDSSTLRPECLPDDGCVGFVVYYEGQVTKDGPHYRDLVTSGDWYVVPSNSRIAAYGEMPSDERIDGVWISPPDISPGDRLVRSAPTLPDDEWKKIYVEMMEAVI